MSDLPMGEQGYNNPALGFCPPEPALRGNQNPRGNEHSGAGYTMAPAQLQHLMQTGPMPQGCTGENPAPPHAPHRQLIFGPPLQAGASQFCAGPSNVSPNLLHMPNGHLPDHHLYNKVLDPEQTQVIGDLRSRLLSNPLYSPQRGEQSAQQPLLPLENTEKAEIEHAIAYYNAKWTTLYYCDRCLFTVDDRNKFKNISYLQYPHLTRHGVRPPFHNYLPLATFHLATPYCPCVACQTKLSSMPNSDSGSFASDTDTDGDGDPPQGPNRGPKDHYGTYSDLRLSGRLIKKILSREKEKAKGKGKSRSRAKARVSEYPVQGFPSSRRFESHRTSHAQPQEMGHASRSDSHSEVSVDSEPKTTPRINKKRRYGRH